MQRERILDEVKTRISRMSGLRRLRFLDDEWRGKIIALERQAEIEEAKNGLIKLKNVGVWECFQRQKQMIIIVDRSAIIIRLTKNLLQISDSHGHLIGEWINSARIGEYRKDPSAIRLGEDFIFYPDVEIDEEPYLIIPKVDFPFLYGTEGIRNVTSGSPSRLTTEFVLSSLKMENQGLWTHLVGFDLVLDAPDK